MIYQNKKFTNLFKTYKNVRVSFLNKNSENCDSKNAPTITSLYKD